MEEEGVASMNPRDGGNMYVGTKGSEFAYSHSKFGSLLGASCWGRGGKARIRSPDHLVRAQLSSASSGQAFLHLAGRRGRSKRPVIPAAGVLSVYDISVSLPKRYRVTWLMESESPGSCIDPHGVQARRAELT